MRPTLKTTTITLAVTLAACASTHTSTASPPGTEPLRYPALPAAPSGSTQVAAFDPSPSLTTLTLACRAEELPLANAIDDDCNGQVDDAPTTDPLLIAVAYPRAAAVALALETPQQQLELTTSSCDDSQSFCTLRIDTNRLARGRHALVVHASPASVEARDSAHEPSAQGAHIPPPSVVVSVQSRGKVTTYLARLDNRTVDQTLGELALP